MFMIVMLLGSSKLQAQTWTETYKVSPTRDSFFHVGYAEAEDINVAQAKAWNAAMSGAMASLMPEAVWIGSQVSETIDNLQSKREVILDTSKIPIKGMSEAMELGSPVVKLEQGKFRVWKLLRWDKKGLETTKAIYDRSKLIAVKPTSLFRVNNRVDQIQAYLDHVECGATIKDMEAVVGPADEFDGKLAVFLTHKIYLSGANRYLHVVYNFQGELTHRICR
jgi:hypothetical protein